MRFDINDSGGDGIKNAGYYRLRRGNVWLQGQVREFDSNNFHYSGPCEIGKSCDNPMPVTSSSMYAQGINDYWFSLKTEVKTNYDINTYISFDDSTQVNIDSKIWIYDGCPSDTPNGPEGALIFNDDIISCTPGSGVSNYPINENRTYIIRVNSIGYPRDGLVGVTFKSSGEIKGCTDPKSCSYNPLAILDDGSCIYEDNCDPDLTISQEEYINSIYLDSLFVEDACLIEENCVSGSGKRDIIIFTTFISNVGDADYIVGNPNVNSDGFSKDNCHEHWHRLGYAEYLLYEEGGRPYPLGFKNGFCLLDIACTNDKNPKYYCDYMGISAGCYDVYDANVECQWLDVTDIPDGNYIMVARINWNRLPDQLGRVEKTFDNNWAQACISLDRTTGKLRLTVNESCSEYRDCMA